MNERFHTDLDDVMACYQTNYSPLGLPLGSENTFENESRKGIKTFMFTTYSQADFFFLSAITSIATIRFAMMFLTSILQVGEFTKPFPKIKSRSMQTQSLIKKPYPLANMDDTSDILLCRSTAYLSRGNFIFSLNKSRTLSHLTCLLLESTDRLLQCFTDSNSLAQVSSYTHQKLFQLQPPFLMLFP